MFIYKEIPIIYGIIEGRYKMVENKILLNFDCDV